MVSRNKTAIKDSILQRVYEENLTISDPYPKRVQPTKQSNSSVHFRVLPVLLITLLLVLVNLTPEPISNQTPQPVTFSSADPVFPWNEMVYNQRPPAAKDPVLSYVRNFIPGDDEAFDAQKLLNYDFLLNQDHVTVSSIFGLDVQTIVIDPGHGGKDPGAVGSQGTREKDIVLDIALRLRDQLMQSKQ